MWRRLLLGLLAVALVSPGSALAQGPVVTTTVDEGDGTCDIETCTLREAVAAAKVNDTIVLKAETYSLTKGHLVLGGTFTIQGAGSRATTIQSDGNGRVALVPEGGNVTVNGVTVAGGFASDEGGGFRVDAGGRLELHRATVRYNTAASGGGISSAGTLQIFQSTVRSNYAGLGAPGNGGGIHVQGGNALLRNTTVTDNWAIAGGAEQPSQGGGIYTTGILTMEHVTISRNLATTGGGLYQASKRARDVAMWNTLLADNREQSCGGDVGLIDGDHNLADDKSCALDGEGDLEDASADLLGPGDHGGPTDTDALGVQSEAIDAATSARCPEVDQRGFARPAEKCDIGAVERRLPPVVTTPADGDDGVCAPDDCTLREAIVDSERDDVIILRDPVYVVELGELQLRGSRMILGQGPRSTTIKAIGPHRVLSVLDGTSFLEGVQITGGDVVEGKGAEGPIGGGIFVGPGAALSVFESAIQGNRAVAGGGIASRGGLSVVSSTIGSNNATGGGGGGLLMDFAGSYIENSTVSGNTASAPGGGIANLGGTLRTLNATIAGNQAPTGGGIYGDIELIDGSIPHGSTRMINTIVATNASAQCAWAPGHERSADHSLADDDSCFPNGGGNQVDPDPGIGPLSQDLGSTDLHPLLDGSPAIDVANDSECPPIDQRGVDRPQGVRCDIGAFEGGLGAPNLRVVVQIPDDSAAASEFTVHVFSAGQEVDSAQGSESGTPFNLPPGTYEIRRTGPDNYVRSFSGDCDGFGKVTIQADETRTCTLTLDAVAAPPDDACLSYPSFAQAAGLNVLGQAAIAGDVLRLNPASGGLGGAWFGARRQIAEGFTTDFKFRITPPPDAPSADGFAFVIQNTDVDALGEGGGGLGYQGIPNSLAVEFDTFSNGPDEDSSHVAVHSLGMQPNTAGAAARLGTASLPSFNDGAVHEVRVAYTPRALKVFVDDMQTPKLTVDVDIWGSLSLINASAFVGFTAATGDFREAHDILDWSLCPTAPATLNVVTEVEGEGGWLPEDFTVGVTSNGADVAGSPQAGNIEGTSYTLDPGSYVVSAAGARGYAATIGGACAPDGKVTLGAESSNTCTITYKPVPVGDGLVVESYGPSRTDDNWGLTEPYLTKTRGYLEDPANFGPNGIVARSLQVAPGIRVANERTLAGVDVLFTGWVPTFSFTEEEKAALHDFVLGGGTLIATTDDTGHTMVDAFGLGQGNGEGEPTTPNTITDLDHPIAAGPFGPVTAFNQYFATGHYPTIPETASAVGKNDAGTSLAVIERGKLGLDSGVAIFVADVDVFSDQGGASDNAALIKNIFAFATGVDPSLRAITDVVNDDGGTAAAGDFSVHLRRDGVEMPGSPATGQAGPGGRLYTLPSGTYGLSADGVPGYTVTFSGDCDQAGSVTLEGDQESTCTVTLDDVAPTLRVITNVVNDDGGPAKAGDFSVHVRRGNEDVQDSPQPGVGGPNGASYTVEVGGPYELSAEGVPGYSVSFSEPCSPEGSITLELGLDAACTITLDDIAPTLRVITTVVNDSGGTAKAEDVSVHVRRNNLDVVDSPKAGAASPPGAAYTVGAGVLYELSASGVTGYAASFSEPCSGGTVTLALDQDTVCTITLDDVAPTLRVVTKVVNDNGGTAKPGDFSVHVRRDDEDVTESPKLGMGEPGTPYTLEAGSYEVAPEDKAGYGVSFSGSCEEGLVDLAIGDDVTCTVTLDDIGPTLQVITEAVNKDGGSAEADDFSVHVRDKDGDVEDSPKAGVADPPGAAYAVDAGVRYELSASGVAGYTASFSEPCSGGTITLALDQDAVCTLTLDDRAPTLTVVTQVVNDNGGSAGPGSFTVHVRNGGSDVGSSPQAGSASGTTHTLKPGAHVVSADGVAGYATAISGACAADGSITLNLGESRSCTVTANDDAPPTVTSSSQQQPQQPQEQEPPPPEAGKTVTAEPKSGTVTIKLKGTNKFVELKEGESVPVGSVLDTTKGRVTLVAASDKSGGTATADFYDGIFKVGQTKGSKPITTLELVEKLSCGSGQASAAAKRKKKRRLWGDGSGRFRTEGEFSSATVRGTKWLVEDQCTSTLTKVARGKVAVRDFVKRKTVIVKAGKQYIARAR